ncbi:MAG: hypothetical protein CVU05_12850 [Bacteroidetes bacterium HGW-Bacteroidetes-21]|nr:MAG: hypothetical protein CVU05_12850 [Bacteroidetes bacterium HGW-Bacteroidetes-21]
MSYYFSKQLPGKSFNEAMEQVKSVLKTEGFGVMTEVDVAKTLKEKINEDFKKYVILGVCNPHYAHQAILAEDKIGLFLPCNVLVEEHGTGIVEVSIIDPVASMMAIENEKLGSVAMEVRKKLQNVVSELQ